MTSELKRAYPKVVASVGDGLKIHVSGREAETLLMLVTSPFRRVEAYDFRGGPPFRLGAYVFDLRQMGLTIRTERVDHAVGWHAAYVLETPLTILTVDDGQHKGQAA
jgi:hypothetical protein